MTATAKTKKRARAKLPPFEIGWREWVKLPELGIAPFKAKIDTGAHSAALHATHIEAFERDGDPWVRFVVPSDRHSHAPRYICTARVKDIRPVKNTSGVPEPRYVVHTTLVLGNRHWAVDITLANRDQMGYRMLLGRASLRRHNVVIHPDRSFLQGAPGAA